MHPSIKNWVLVTGSPRSATTFIGKVLSSSPTVDYIHEPFNPDCGIRGIEHSFVYLDEASDDRPELRREIDRLFDFRAPLRTGYYMNDRPWRRFAKRFVGSRGPFNLRIAKLNPFSNAAVIKCPAACLLMPYLMQRYGVRPIVTVRHPVGFVASTLRIGWDLSLNPILSQPRALARYLEPEDHEAIERWAGGSRLQRAAMTWRLLNRALLKTASQDARIHVTTHEAVCKDAEAAFKPMFEHAGLPFTDRVRKRLDELTGGTRAVAREGRVQDFKRDSKSIPDQGFLRLQRAEIDEVLQITAPVARLAYDEQTLWR